MAIQLIRTFKVHLSNILKSCLGLFLVLSFSPLHTMDLRHIQLSPYQISQMHRFIIQRKMAYQPFIFTNNLEVGEGYNFINGRDFLGNIYWSDNPSPEIYDLLVQDLASFREHNQHLRTIYEYFLDTFVESLGGNIQSLDFAEIGCNTGYFLHGLALRGAKRCIGYDFTENTEVFNWFNQVLGIHNEFYFAEWDSRTHTLNYADMPEVDVAISINVTCHLADPVYHIAFLCDHAKKAVFLCCPVNFEDETGLSISYGYPSRYPNSLDFPLCFDNTIKMSKPLIRLAFEKAGFEEIYEIEPPSNIPSEWKSWYNAGKLFLAFRTKQTKTALNETNRNRNRQVPADAAAILNAKPKWNWKGFK